MLLILKSSLLNHRNHRFNRSLSRRVIVKKITLACCADILPAFSCLAEESFMNYIIKPGDTLKCDRCSTDEISREVIVQKDGNIT